ncbi:mitochondrial gtpase 1 [Stylonychia lemnae]|uniref:Mitochondrial gtpase 1 n=1 Tax=Stylonychia lemnae TaxID=5949 RepID=A0A078AZP0_STYLE|nr:mitochondrial gtpase 1 [Stylonychia lemnae]|eukprot:CDW87566.1 mitochondrial gtpase 1 [Stylonychia lemnae]
MNEGTDTYMGLAQDDDLGPMKSVEGYTLCVTGLHGEVQEEDLQDLFGAYGQVKNLHLNLDRRTGYAKGYAFLEFEELKIAKKAIDELNDKLLLEVFHELPRAVNWFPGHMKKAILELETEMKKTDLFIEVRDARIPYTSHNTELLSHIPLNMKRLIVFNKMDLANEKKTLQIIQDIQNKDKNANTLHISTKKNVNVSKLLTFIQKNISPQFKTVGAWVMIGGIPNVGKSTIINALRKKDENAEITKKSGAKVGGIPCITKTITGFKIMSDPPTYMVDTPGIIQPKIRENSEDGLKLCACNNIRDGIIELEFVCDYILFKLNKDQNFAYVNRFSLPNRKPNDNLHEVLNSVMNRFKVQQRSNAVDIFLRDFREGKLGQITLDELAK